MNTINRQTEKIFRTSRVLVGIDPGTHTGLAVWNGSTFTEVTSLPLHAALLRVKELNTRLGFKGNGIVVVFEDARLRKWYGTSTARQDRARLQGAGSVKRDCAIWEDPLRSPAQVEGTQGFLPQPGKDLERPSSTRLEARFPYHGSGAMTRSPSPLAWRPDFPGRSPEENFPQC